MKYANCFFPTFSNSELLIVGGGVPQVEKYNIQTGDRMTL